MSCLINSLCVYNGTAVLAKITSSASPILELQLVLCDSECDNLKTSLTSLLQVVPLSGSLNGDLLLSSGLAASTGVSDLPLPQKPLVRGSLSVAPADYQERPEVTLRREMSSSTLPLKTEVPLHLFSTTNQLHKPVGVQQQIPTKLAAFSSGKGKGGKISKASHRTDSSGKDGMGSKCSDF